MRRMVYVCHKFGDDPEGNTANIREICAALVADGLLPIAPQLLLPQFMSEATQREEAMLMCLQLIDHCDVVFHFGPASNGVLREIARANALAIPVVYRQDFYPEPLK